jgi:diguanylate cyclase (GGDEF)-like protein
LEQEKYSVKRLIHALERSQARLIDQFYTDTLTRLPNLYKLRHDLERLDDFVLIIVNIDNFKLLNNFYGFVVGDFILESFGQTLQKSCPNDQVYRIAGDEFAIICPRGMSFYGIKTYLVDLCKKLDYLFYTYRDIEIFVDFTLSSSASRSHDNIFSKVNMALKYAKEHGLRFWIYEDTMHFIKEHETNLRYATHIRKAIVDNKGIVPYFQPIIDNNTGKIVKFEALSRLVDSEGIIHAPNHFIPVAKTIKVYDKITKLIIEKTFDVFAKLPHDFSINLSFEDIMNQDIYSYIIQKLRYSNMGSRVTFELLESEQVEDFEKVKRFIIEVKRYRAKVAIDDFGSGFSNFSYIIKLAPDYIKIDGSLIKDLDTDDNARIVVETIVEFSKKLGIKTIAEFVHSSTILSAVKKLGIDYSQGYYIEKPLAQLPSI